MFNNVIEKANKYYHFISILLLFSFNLFTLDNLPFGDDYHFIFDNFAILKAPNPFVYFFPWSVYFKGWSFSYFFVWILYRLFVDNYAYYRAVTLLIHFLNHYLFRKILQNKFKLSKGQTNLISLLFLFHPVSVLTTNWIFQIKTLLATMFFLLLILALQNYKKNYKSYFKIIGLFWLSLISKIVAICFPIALFFFFKRKHSFKKSTLLIIPFILLSTAYGFLNIKGVASIFYEKKNMQELFSEKVEEKVVFSDKSEEARLEEIVHEARLKDETVSFKINITEEVTKSGAEYLRFTFNPDTFSAKYSVALQNLGRLMLYSLGLNVYFPFYESNEDTAAQKIIFLYASFGIFFIFLLYKLRSDFLMISFILFLPVCGFFYISYMKYSFTSDHWFYPSVTFFLLAVAKTLTKNKYILHSAALIIFSNFMFTIYNYSDFYHLLEKNKEYHTNLAIDEHQLQYDILLKNNHNLIKNSLKIHQYLEPQDPRFPAIAHNAALKLNRKDLISYLYPKVAKYFLHAKNLQELHTFNTSNYGVIPNKELDIVESFDIFFSQKINEQTYQKVLSHLQ